MAATMKDIASRSGLSVFTVSKYINGGKVKEQNREKIESAIDELGYHINQTARSLKTNQSMTVGIIIEDLGNMFYTSVVSVINDCLLEHGYSSIISEAKAGSEDNIRKLDLLISKRVDGIILLTSQCDERFLELCRRHDVHLVVVDSVPREHPETGAGFDFVLTDNRRGAWDATDYLLQSGHRDIAVFTGFDSHYSASQRLAGYEQCLRGHGLEPDPSNIFVDEYNIGGGYRCAGRMAQLQRQPTAVLVCNYLMGLGAMVCFNEQNRGIGRDLSIVCFDEMQASKSFRPQITTVGQSLTQIGKTAAERILQRVKNKDVKSGVVEIPAQLIIRDSVAQISKQDDTDLQQDKR